MCCRTRCPQMATLGDVHAEVPAETGKNLVACMVCRLLKTFDQARFSNLVLSSSAQRLRDSKAEASRGNEVASRALRF